MPLVISPFTSPDIFHIIPSYDVQNDGYQKSANVTRIRKLVGGFNPSEKYESQLGLLFPKYYIYIWKVIKFMFQITNQYNIWRFPEMEVPQAR